MNVGASGHCEPLVTGIDCSGRPRSSAGPEETTDLMRALRRAIGALPEEYRDPLLLQVLGGFTCQEIGEMLNLTPSTVMARVSRARRRLRERLTGLAADQGSEGSRQ